MAINPDVGKKIFDKLFGKSSGCLSKEKRPWVSVW
jgi:hypothetical protein